jgi:ATP/ADP translocase
MFELQDIVPQLLTGCFAMLIVLFAMCIDLGSGLYKAKLRNEIRTSQALKRTLSKFIAYEGGMMIATGVDILLHISRLWSVIGVTAFEEVPMVTCLVGVFLLVVEFLSVREKADQKTKNKMNEAAYILGDVLSKDTVKSALEKMIKNAIEESGKECVETEKDE